MEGYREMKRDTEGVKGTERGTEEYGEVQKGKRAIRGREEHRENNRGVYRGVEGHGDKNLKFEGYFEMLQLFWFDKSIRNSKVHDCLPSFVAAILNG